ncbi:MAG TPA: hypothetical protein VFG04_26735 [Planctomycetaceae bacterium]|jgi:hypothetical protein|nr:hypothetical protein [Planctomycetaceae bacterium]
MSPQIRSLAWKEWRERRASLALATAWIVCGATYAIAYETVFHIRGPVSSLYVTCLLYGLFVAVFLAMRTSLGERTEGTLDFSSALPVTLRQAAGIRLAGAIITLAGPIFLGAALLSIVLLTGAIEQSPARPPHDPNYLDFTNRASLSRMEAIGFTWKCASIAAAQGIELLLILAVIGARRRSEAHVGFIGAIVGFGWFVATGVRDSGFGSRIDWLGAVLPQTLVIAWGYSTAEGHYSDLEFASRVWGPLCLNLLTLVGLSAWFTRRYAAAFLSARPPSSWKIWRPPALLSRLPLRWPGRVAALISFDLRQSVPLALAGLALAFFMAVAQLFISWGPVSALQQDASVTAIACGRLPGSIWIVALLWSAVVGSGIFGAELQPGLGNFWRSRPISASSWFWVKFAVGLIAVLAVLDGTTIVVSWNSPYASGPDRMSWSYVTCMPLLHAMMYSLAVFGACKLRRPVLGAMCAVVPFFLLSFVLETFPTTQAFDPSHVYNSLFWAETASPGVFDLSGHHYPLVYGAVALVSGLTAFSAFRAIRNWNPST